MYVVAVFNVQTTATNPMTLVFCVCDCDSIRAGRCFFFSQVPTLDGRVLRLPCPEVVSPGYERRLGGEGMPISKNPGSRGDLLIRFKLVFPAFLPQASKVLWYTTYRCRRPLGGLGLIS